MLSLNAIGMPWNGLRKRPAARSASNALASAIARGISGELSIACVGPHELGEFS